MGANELSKTKQIKLATTCCLALGAGTAAREAAGVGASGTACAGLDAAALVQGGKSLSNK
jgi:hypothetical protein